MNLFKKFANTFDKHGVTIENDDSSDMKKSAYDADGSVAEAGGIASYVESHGSGLPDPSSYSDGTVLIKVGSEWKAQSGYGYTEESAFEKITWDGNTEGHEVLEEAFCKVSDISIPSSALTGSKIKVYNNGEIEEYDFASLESAGTDFYTAFYDGEMLVIVVLEDTVIEEKSMHKGVYFMFAEGEGYANYILELSFAPVVHTIDNKFIDFPPAPDKCLSFYLNEETGYISRAYLNGIRIENPTYDMLKNIIYDAQLRDRLIKIPIYLFFAYTPANDVYMKVTDISLVPYGGYEPEHISMYASYINQNGHKLVLYIANIYNSDNVLDLDPYSKIEYTLTPAE